MDISHASLSVDSKRQSPFETPDTDLRQISVPEFIIAPHFHEMSALRFLRTDQSVRTYHIL